jgi:hypothetical protein
MTKFLGTNEMNRTSCIYNLLVNFKHMKNFKSILFICLVFTTITQAQVKLGNNPSNTHPTKL